jgi:hypothetical protein
VAPVRPVSPVGPVGPVSPVAPVAPVAPVNTVFANAFSSGYQYAVQYFDYLGRTIGAQTDIDASFTTPSLPTSYNYPITKFYYIYILIYNSLFWFFRKISISLFWTS